MTIIRIELPESTMQAARAADELLAIALPESAGSAIRRPDTASLR